MSMEMTANIAQPQWKLDELPTIIEQRMEERIDSVSQLNLYMQRNEADLIYGSRIIAQIEAILREVRKAGLNRDVAVATESLRPGTIPKAVQSILTSNYSRTHQKETVIALESYANFGKISLIVMVMLGIMKILSWIISNAVPFAGAADVDGDEYRDKLLEKIDAVPFIERLKITALKEAYADASKGLKDGELNNLELAILMADEVLTNMNAEDLLNKLSAALGRSPFVGMFKDYTKRRQNEQQVIHDILDTLLRTNIGCAVFSQQVCDEVYKGLPADVRKAGVNIPNEAFYRQMGRNLENFSAGLKRLEQSLKDLKMYYLSGDRTLGTNQENRISATGIVQALALLNGEIEMGLTDFASCRGAPLPTMMVKSDRGLIGYSSREFGNGFIIASAGVNSYFGSAANMEIMRQELSFTSGDSRELLACLITLVRSGITKGPADTSLDRFKVVEKQIEKVVSQLKDMSRQSRSGMNSKAWQMMEQAFRDEAQRSELYELNFGRELTTMTVMDPDRNVWDSVAFTTELIKSWTTAAGALATILKRAKNNPLVKGGKFNKLVD